MMKPVLAGAVFALAAAAGGDGRAAPVATSFTLENGLRAVVIEDRRAPVVTHMVWYRVGSADEPPGKTGIAHFLEHLMFKGTESIPAGRFSEIVAENGGQDNAFTSRDYTAYFQRIAVDRLGLVMEMEADRMRGLVIDPESVAAERDVVIEERNSRVENDPAARYREQFNATFYLNHPYGAPVIGWREEIEGLTRADALEFYQRFYAPNNATLIVAGDVDAAEVERLAREHYGPIEAVALPPSIRASEPPHAAARRIAMEDPRARQPVLTRAYRAPSHVSGEPGEADALKLLSDILGGGQTRRLQKTLTIDSDLAIYAGAGYWGMARDDVAFTIYAAPKEGVPLAKLEGAIDWILRDLVENGVTEEELARARKAAIADAIYDQDNQQSMARRYGVALTVGLSVEDVEGWRERLEAVTVDDVNAVARKYLRPEAAVTGWLETARSGEAIQ